MKKPSEKAFVIFCEGAQEGNFKAVRNFIEKYGVAYIDRKFNSNQKTALMYAATYGHLDIFRYLVEKGADVILSSPGSWDALHWALATRSVDIVRECMNFSFDMNAIDNLGNPRLKYAVEPGIGRVPPEVVGPEMTKLLLDAGADPDVKSGSGLTMMEIAENKGYSLTVQFLKAAMQERRTRDAYTLKTAVSALPRIVLKPKSRN